MNTNALLSLAPKLAAEALTLETLLSSGKSPTDFLVMQSRKRCRVLAADLQSAAKEPVRIKPYSAWNGIER